MALNIALINVLINYDVFYMFRYFQLELLLGIGPALYFYTKSITDQNFKFTRKEFVHFIPVILEFIFYRTSFYRLGADGMYETPPHPYTKIYLAEQWLGILSISIYTILSLRTLYNCQIWLKQHYSNLEKRSLDWLKTPVIIYSAFWIGWNILTEVDRIAFDRALKDLYFLPTFVGLAVVSCWIGFKGYMRSQVGVSGYSNEKPQLAAPSPNPELAARLTSLMEHEHPYLDPDLDLSKLSELLDMNPKQVSATINGSFSKNFYEYINQYRVAAFKHRMHQPEINKLTLVGHAFECGFKSKSTFNDVFKKMTGKTPSEYVKSLKKESERK
ncbi:helix-turn-helix domain-containing protein, partial [Fulvivirga lutimaris]|uniref:helix-turn-helix domain-containing protein n=1 Tax=Fulvivirga lutimaris TaxID=1819566 RepID=UPI001629371E